jgi:tripartite ATP-independent transporter DctM subunit
MLLLFGSFIVLLIIGVPVGFSLFASSVMYIAANGLPFEMAAQRLVAGPDSFPLLAIAFFVLAGNIMNSAGITRRIFDFADCIVGHFTGGLGHANILASIIFSGMSGSAVADAGGLGQIEMEAMKKAGYDDDFSLAITGASSIIGPIIPPSIPAVIFGVISGVSVGKLFAGGIIPGLLMGLSLSVMVYFYCKKRGYERRKRASLRELLTTFQKAFFPLLTPLIIIGGIVFGFFTPTEAAIIAVFYAVLLGLIYKAIKLQDLPRFLRETLITTIGILFIISSANMFGWLLTISQVPQNLAVSFMSVISNKYVALIVLNLFLLLVGMFLETSAAQIILVPILVPMVIKLGIDPVHFGILMILNLMIGLMTPPVGLVLYVLASIAKVPVMKIAKLIMPYILVLFVVLLVVTFVPNLVMFLPNLLFK